MIAQTRLLMDLRPCYEGFAGIPQEARLLFAMFLDMGFARLGGLASAIHFVGQRRRGRRDTTSYERTLDQTQALITQDTKRHHIPLGMRLVPDTMRRGNTMGYAVAAYAGRAEKLDLPIDPVLFEDYLWTKLFERTLPPSARHLLPRAEYFATELGHENARHLCFLPAMFQRRIATAPWDVFLACSVSPYRISPQTSMLVRYYDPLPLLSPHTVGEPWQHALSHARMLHRNMSQGATFVCDSEPIREDVLRLFPRAERHVHTIPCLMAPEYRPDVQGEDSLRTILHRRASTITSTGGAGSASKPPPGPLPRLVMAVSTLEPRKNYLRLFRAFEVARRRTAHPIQLVVVANPGWRSDAEIAELKLLVREGAFHLAGVPLPELRQLYSMAHLVVAPSRAEGFDYSGVEAMACGTPVLASDTAVHRWVYGDAAEYADAYDEYAMADRVAALCDLPREEGHLAGMRDRGLRRAALYTVDALRPSWEQLLDRLGSERRAA